MRIVPVARACGASRSYRHVDHVRLALRVEVGQRGQDMGGSLGETIRGHHSDASGHARRRPTPVTTWFPRSPPLARGRLRSQPAVPAPLRAQNNLPALGDAATEDFGVATERHVGEQIMREIRRDPDYLRRPAAAPSTCRASGRRWSASRAKGHITPTSIRASPGRPSWCATAASTPSRCRAATSACTSG